ncbi:uncharacterized protein [Halyomorpha halys]|uniref:uncharacterized protein n=1 Tax=Halyomorpha halys TaxID=286706 RepID=UPI0006D50E0F|nr:uncharacterized protein LOC106685112 [Halyomorpha halys]KAE8573844.1 EcKinase 11 [Halyomorpha halys]
MALQSRDIHEVIRSYLKSNDFEIISCEGADLDGICTGFLSAQDKARIRFKTSRGEDELHVFMKTLPDAAYHRENILAMGSFHREVVLFNEVLNKYHDYLKDNSIPACYLARSEGLMVMEDLLKKGFKNKPLRETLDLEHCKKTIETLAKFHALSFIMEKKEGRKMTEIVPVIKTEMIMSKDENHVGRKGALAQIRCMKRVTEKYLTHVPTKVVEKAVYYLDNLFDEMKSSKLYPNVLSHADLWANNIMFSYDDQGNVKEACIFDFQLATYKAPGYDIQQFLHCCTDNDLRERHFGNLMRLYYNVLSRMLKSAAIDVDDIMNWEDFENMLKETQPTAVATACMFLICVLVPEDILKDVMSSDEKYKEYYEGNREQYILEAMEKDMEFKRRIIQSVTNFINLFDTDE